MNQYRALHAGKAHAAAGQLSRRDRPALRGADRAGRRSGADVLANRGWRIVGPTEFPPEATEITIEAQANSPLLGFPSDVAIRLIDEDTSTYVDMRSTSRYGPHDFGDNAARIASFLAELDIEIAYLTVVTPVEPAEPTSAAETARDCAAPAGNRRNPPSR